MSVLPVGMGSGGYEITNSVRLRSSASAYFSRTFGTPTDNNVCTYVCRVKRGALGSTQPLLSVYIDASNYAQISFDSLDRITVSGVNAGTTYLNAVSTSVYRDPSGHYDVLVAFNRADSTDSNRVKVYVNGTQITAWTTTPTWNNAYNNYINNATRAHSIGRFNTAYLDGILSDIYFIDGQALTPSSFGETNSDGVWVPKAYTGTYGTNGFHLEFKDNSALTATAFGKDTSGNGNNWTPQGSMSLTLGVNYDSFVDTPTNNYCTLNPLDKDRSQGTIVDANLGYSTLYVDNYATARGTLGIQTGKWAMQVNSSIAAGTGNSLDIGFTSDTRELTLGGQFAGAVPFVGIFYPGNSGTAIKYANGTSGTNITGSSVSSTALVNLLIDLDAGKCWAGVSGQYWNTSNTLGAFDESSPTITFTPTGLTFFPVVTVAASLGDGNRSRADINFGQRPFSYTPPSGYKALCTANLPTVAIPKPAKHFDVKTRAGDSNSTQTTTGIGFAPEFVWTKSRTNADAHVLSDVLRGTGKGLSSNSTNAEQTNDNNGYLSAFTSDGYTMSNGSSSGLLVKANAVNYVDWLWKAGGTPTTDNVAGAGNTPTAGSVKIDGADLGSALAGSIATTRLSANTVAGFSVVTYTGTGANATVAHGLGVAPKMVIVKSRNPSGGFAWAVWHTAFAGTDALQLQSTAAKLTDATLWNSTTPNSSVFSLGTGIAANETGKNYVAYCFAEIAGFSKFGSYTGNGSTDGPFVWCGFRPKYVMIKEISGTNAATSSWTIHDAARYNYNQDISALGANSSSAETSNSSYGLDILSNGFKLRSTNQTWNESSGSATYIFAAFAEFPFGGINVSPSPAR